MKTFAQNLSNVIKAKRYSLKEVAEGTGIPRTTLHEWVQGRSPQVTPDLMKLAKFLGVSLQYLLTGEDDPNAVVKAILKNAEVRAGRYLVTIEPISE